jgi:hypothetical protein
MPVAMADHHLTRFLRTRTIQVGTANGIAARAQAKYQTKNVPARESRLREPDSGYSSAISTAVGAGAAKKAMIVAESFRILERLPGSSGPL